MPQMDTPSDPNFGRVGAPAGAPVDVDAVLADLASRKDEKLNYKTSIVDLMKLLDLDSSLANRKELATELGYTGRDRRQRRDEHLAPQAGDGQARRQWRQGLAPSCRTRRRGKAGAAPLGVPPARPAVPQ